MLPYVIVNTKGIFLFIIFSFVTNYEAAGLEKVKSNAVQKHIDRNKVLVGDLFETDFSVARPERCKKSFNYSIFIFVISAPNHFAHREVIRNTRAKFGIDSTNLISFAFLIGNTDWKTNKLIETEDKMYRDIVRSNNIDTYDNLTLKVCSMLAWIHKFCQTADFIIKSDDDVFINYNKLLKFISMNFKSKRNIYGKVGNNVQVDRRKNSKYFVPYNVYKPDIYPKFLVGSAYLLSKDVVYGILINTLYHTFFKLEDVLITGFVAGKLKIGKKSLGIIKDRNIWRSKFSRNDIVDCIMIFNIKLEDHVAMLSLIGPVAKIN